MPAPKKIPSKSLGDLKDMIETKVTRSEAIDIMLDSLREEVNARKKKLEEERHDLYKDLRPADVISAFAHYEDLNAAKMDVRRNCWAKDNEINITFSLLPKEGGLLAGRVARQIEIEKELNDCIQMLNRVNGKEAKTFLLKQMIGQTAEGRLFLGRMDTMLEQLRRALKAQYLLK